MKKERAVILIIVAFCLGVSTHYLTDLALQHAIGSIAEEELSRATSPDGRVDAVVTEANPGAFSSFVHNIYIVPKGEKAQRSGDPAIVSTIRGDDPKVAWQSPHFLNVNVGNSHVTFFGNVWYSEKVPNYFVELTLSASHYLQPNGELSSSH